MMPRFTGRIAFDVLAVPDSPLDVPSHASPRSLQSAGLMLQWDPRHVDVAFRNGVLALATGSGRDDTTAGRGEAARWLDRYARRAESAATDVGGGFGAVIIDCNRRRALLLVDRFGIEALCYRHAGRTLTFADRACDVPGTAKSISRQSLFDYLFFHVIPAPQTVYADVTRLAAAHRLVVSETSAVATRYWRPDFTENDHGRLSARKHEFVDLVQKAVNEEADQPSTACFLSGGTDSSTIAGMLTRARGVPAHAYSIGFEAEGYDEMEYARLAAHHFGLAHHEYYLTPDDLVDAIPGVAASLDQPFGNSSVLPSYFCALRARADGFTRMLAGDGGDELFGGNARYALQNLFEIYHALPRRLRASVLEPLACQSTLLRRVPGLRQLGGYVRHARPEMPDRLNGFNLLHFIGMDAVLDPEFRAHIDVESPTKQQRAIWGSSRAASLTNRMLEYDWKFTLADSDLPKVRAASQSADITVGYPFLSRQLVDFSVNLPPRWKVRNFKLRWFFKQALAGFLPGEILRKKKHGFGLPFGAWVLRHEPLRALADDALDGIATRGIVSSSMARELMISRLPQAPAFYGEMVWILMMLELWLRSHEASLPFTSAGVTGHREQLAAGERR